MSEIYPDLENKFPLGIDDFEKFVDPDIAALTAINQYYTLYDSGDLVGAKNILETNPNLKRMIINAENLNKLRDGLISVERYYLNDVQQYLVEIVKYKGSWSSSAKYTKYDVVTYVRNGATESFMGIATDIPIGTLPTSTTYFIPITIRGEQGESGTGLSPRGYWLSTSQYYQDDCVSYNNMLWYAKRDNLNKVPQPVSDDWEVILQMPQQIAISSNEPSGQNPDDLWFALDADNFDVKRKTASGTYDMMYPKTKASAVKFDDNTTVEAHKSTHSNSSTYGHTRVISTLTSTSSTDAASASVARSILAATGTTSGTGSVLSLVQSGFVLFDNACARIKLHADILDNATLNINSTGAKPIYMNDNSRIKKGAKAGSFLNLAYNSALGRWYLLDTVSDRTDTNVCKVQVNVTSYNGTNISGRTIKFVSDSDRTTYQTSSTGTVIAKLPPGSYTVTFEDTISGYFSPAPQTLTAVGGQEYTVNFFMAQRTTLTYGVKIDKNNSNPSTCVTYTDAATGLSPSYTFGNSFVDNGWGARLSDMVGMKPCLLKNGIVQYYLNPNDFTLKEDGSSSDIITGNDGDVMIEFKKCYLSITSDDNYVYVKISDHKVDDSFTDYPFSYGGVIKDKFYIGAYEGYVSDSKLYSLSGKTPSTSNSMKRSNYRSYAQAKGAGYEIVPYNKFVFLQALYLIRFRNLDSQSALGRGYTLYGSTITGQLNASGMCFGNVAAGTSSPIKCNGIENLWGGRDEWLDGFISFSKTVYTADGNFSDTNTSSSSNVAQITFTVNNFSGFMQDIQGTNAMGFFPKQDRVGGSETTYYCDEVEWSQGSSGSGWTGVMTGKDGVFGLSCPTISYVTDNTGARLAYMG